MQGSRMHIYIRKKTIFSGQALTECLSVCLSVSGFTPGARELFKQENHLALYQLPSGEKTKEFTSRRLNCVTKRQPPISHLISLFVRDSSSSKCHGATS